MPARINPDIFYVNGVPLPSSYFQALDTAQANAVTGDTGGFYTPSSPITIAGNSGVWLCGPSTLSAANAVENFPASGTRITHGDSDFFQLQSGRARTLVTSLGNAIDISSVVPAAAPPFYNSWQASHAYVLGNVVIPAAPNGLAYYCGTAGTTGGSAPSFSTTIDANTADNTVNWTTIPIPFLEAPSAQYSYEVVQSGTINRTYPTWQAGTLYQRAQVVIPSPPNGFVYLCTALLGTSGGSAPTWPTTVGASVLDGTTAWVCEAIPAMSGGRIICPLRVHNGGTISGVTVWFAVTQTRLSLPASMPQMRVIAVDGSGNVTPLLSNPAAFGWTGNGYITLPTPGSASAYYNTGANQAFSYACDAGVIADTTQFTYYVEIVDESGANAMGGNNWVSASTLITPINDLSPG